MAPTMENGPNHNGHTQRFAVVVAFDDTPEGEVAVDSAYREVAGKIGAELHIIHALGAAPSGPYSAAALEKLSTRLDQAAGELRTHFDGRSIKPPLEAGMYLHVRLDDPAPAVLQLAADVDADLIVVGTRGTKGIKRAIWGSIAADLVKDAACPVLVAVHKDYSQETRSKRVEDTCVACYQKRVETHGATWWCSRHENETRLPLHVAHYHRFARLGARAADYDAP